MLTKRWCAALSMITCVECPVKAMFSGICLIIFFGFKSYTWCLKRYKLKHIFTVSIHFKAYMKCNVRCFFITYNCVHTKKDCNPSSTPAKATANSKSKNRELRTVNLYCRCNYFATLWLHSPKTSREAAFLFHVRFLFGCSCIMVAGGGIIPACHGRLVLRTCRFDVTALVCVCGIPLIFISLITLVPVTGGFISS